MKLIREIPGAQDRLSRPVVAVGNFDGVHLGHQAILGAVVARAREEGGTALALTFDPHPIKVLLPQRTIHLLTSFHQKARLLELMGLDCLLSLPFTREFSEQKPVDFVNRVLHRGVGAREVYVGRNFAFGHGREGTAEDLKQIGGSLGMKVTIIEPIVVGGTVVSSSRIRKFLLEGEVTQAALLLGRPYEIEGRVVGGEKRGRLLGFPTANLQPPAELIPRAGVYAVRVKKGEGEDPSGGQAAVGYIGSRPTFGPGAPAIEVHLFEPQEDLYQERLRVSFLERLRDETAFSGPDDLARQIQKDVERAKEIHAQIERKDYSQADPAG